MALGNDEKSLLASNFCVIDISSDPTSIISYDYYNYSGIIFMYYFRRLWSPEISAREFLLDTSSSSMFILLLPLDDNNRPFDYWIRLCCYVTSSEKLLSCWLDTVPHWLLVLWEAKFLVAANELCLLKLKTMCSLDISNCFPFPNILMLSLLYLCILPVVFIDLR